MINGFLNEYEHSELTQSAQFYTSAKRKTPVRVITNPNLIFTAETGGS